MGAKTKEEYRRRDMLGLCVTCARKRTGKKKSCESCLAAKSKSQSKFRNAHLDSAREACRKHYRTSIMADPDYNKKWQLRKRYGIEIDEFFEILKSQNGGCAICGKKRAFKNKTTKSLHVDHCHRTGVVRGVLCNSCNWALGHFGDSKDGLLLAIKYLDGLKITKDERLRIFGDRLLDSAVKKNS